MTTQLTGQHRHYMVSVENGLLCFKVYYRGTELKRVALKVHAVLFYNWLGKELGVQRCGELQQGNHTVTAGVQTVENTKT